MQPRCEGLDPLQEDEELVVCTRRGLLPIRRYGAFLWKGGRITHVAHEALASGLVSASLSQNLWEVSRKGVGAGSATRCRPRDHIPQFLWGQKCLEVSTSRGRRGVERRGSGRTGGSGWAGADSCSHRAQ
jgi:hypothetical protein